MPVPAQMVEALRLLPPELVEKARDYFAYSFPTFEPLAAGTSDTETVTIQADSDFLAMAIAGTARDPAAPDTIFDSPPITVVFEDTGSGRNIQNRAMDWHNVMGTAELPFFLPFPKYLDGTSVVRLTLENLDAAQDFDVRVVLHGFKVFNFTWGSGRARRG